MVNKLDKLISVVNRKAYSMVDISFNSSSGKWLLSVKQGTYNPHKSLPFFVRVFIMLFIRPHIKGYPKLRYELQSEYNRVKVTNNIIEVGDSLDEVLDRMLSRF